MRVVTYNIHSAIGLDGVTSIERIADVIAGLSPDIVGLNEVRVTRRDNHARRLGELLEMDVAFQRNLVTPLFRFGNAVMTRGEILGYRHVPLPGEGEHRGLLLTTLRVAGQTLTFGSTHLGLTPADQAVQKLAVLDALPENGPIVVAGDFNALADALDPITSRLHPATPLPSFPASGARSAIDFVLHSPDLVVERVFTVPTDASDHLPVVVDFARA